LEDLDRKTKTIELQSKNQQEFTKTMLKLKQQLDHTNETTIQLRTQLEKKEVENKVRSFVMHFHDHNTIDAFWKCPCEQW